MKTRRNVDRYVVARDRNVVCVNFQRKPEPPAPKFPGAGALRILKSHSDGSDLSTYLQQRCVPGRMDANSSPPFTIGRQRAPDRQATPKIYFHH